MLHLRGATFDANADLGRERVRQHVGGPDQPAIPVALGANLERGMALAPEVLASLQERYDVSDGPCNGGPDAGQFYAQYAVALAQASVTLSRQAAG